MMHPGQCVQQTRAIARHTGQLDPADTTPTLKVGRLPRPIRHVPCQTLDHVVMPTTRTKTLLMQDYDMRCIIHKGAAWLSL